MTSPIFITNLKKVTVAHVAALAALLLASSFRLLAHRSSSFGIPSDIKWVEVPQGTPAPDGELVEPPPAPPAPPAEDLIAPREQAVVEKPREIVKPKDKSADMKRNLPTEKAKDKTGDRSQDRSKDKSADKTKDKDKAAAKLRAQGGANATGGNRPIEPGRRIRYADPRGNPNAKTTQQEIARLLAQGHTPGAETRFSFDEEARGNELIRQTYYNAWTQPTKEEAGDAVAVVSIGLAIDGTVTSRRMKTPSGNPSFDASVKAAADSVQRIPGLTQSFLKNNRLIDVTFKVL